MNRSAVLWLLLALGGCKPPVVLAGPAAKCETQAIDLTLTASDRINPDDEGRPLPTQFRIYQLKSLSRLETVEFEDLWRRAPEVLAEDLLHADEMTLYPSKQQVKSITRDPKANYLVGIAIVRRPAGTSWRGTYVIPKPPLESACADLRGSFFLENSNVEVWPRLFDKPAEKPDVAGKAKEKANELGDKATEAAKGKVEEKLP